MGFEAFPQFLQKVFKNFFSRLVSKYLGIFVLGDINRSEERVISSMARIFPRSQVQKMIPQTTQRTVIHRKTIPPPHPPTINSQKLGSRYPTMTKFFVNDVQIKIKVAKRLGPILLNLNFLGPDSSEYLGFKVLRSFFRS